MIVIVSPDLYGPASEYVIAAVGAVVSTEDSISTVVTMPTKPLPE